MNEILNQTINNIDSMREGLLKLFKENQVIQKVSFRLKEINDKSVINDFPRINTKNKVIYMFNVENDFNFNSFLDLHQQKKHSIKLPKINRTNTDSKVIYVGSVNKNFKTRIQQHLGFGSDKTYSLQLKKWVKMDTPFTLEYYILEEIDEFTLRLLESNFASTLRPLLGKHIIY